MQTSKKCSMPCADYPVCSCVPDLDKYYAEVEREDYEFQRIPCEGCGGEFGECYCAPERDEDDFDCGQLADSVCMRAGSEDCEFECPYNNHK